MRGLRRGALTALLLGTVLTPIPPGATALRVDFDGARLTWTNDEDGRVLGRREGEERILATSPLLARPLTVTGVLRFAPCRALREALGQPSPADPQAAAEPGAPEPRCDEAVAPPGPDGLTLTEPLPPSWRPHLLQLWERGQRPLPPEQKALQTAMEAAALRLGSGIRYDEAVGMLRPLAAAVAGAETLTGAEGPGVDPDLLERARRAEGMGRALLELWRRRIALTSRDVSLPCDLLERHARAFNRAAGGERVKLQAERPRGICLFCGNVCTPASADRLLGDMKAALREELAQAE